MSPRLEPITGRYLHLEIDGRPHRVYFEEAGQGIPLLCLHTAGSDGRQYRGLLNDERITRNYRVIVFDMPWHGKSSPPAGWQRAGYKLTSRAYVDTIVAVVDALDLDKPVVMGEFPAQGLSAFPYKGLPARTAAEFSHDLFEQGYAGSLSWAFIDGGFPVNPGITKSFADSRGCEVAY